MFILKIIVPEQQSIVVLFNDKYLIMKYYKHNVQLNQFFSFQSSTFDNLLQYLEYSID